MSTKEAKEYIVKSGLLQAMDVGIRQMLIEQPEDAITFMAQHLLGNLPGTLPEPQHKLLDAFVAKLKANGTTLVDAVPNGITADDVLIIVDMQNDFVPPGSFGVAGAGAFGCPEGDSAAAPIIKLIERCAEVGATIVATRDYHPMDHCSFNTCTPSAGPFPPHCVQGTLGSKFCPPIRVALEKARQKPNCKVHIVYKGYSASADSFGAVEYTEAGAKDRITTKIGPDEPLSCALKWTGSHGLFCSNQKADLDAPPDVMSILKYEDVSIQKLVGHGKRFFVTGLALDYCVLDTAANGRQLPTPFEEVHIVVDAARAAYIEGVGEFDGFLQDPANMSKKLKDNDIKLCVTEDLLV